MTLHSESHTSEPLDTRLTKRDIAVLDQFAQLVAEKAQALAQGPDRVRVLRLVRRALLEVQEALADKGSATEVRPAQIPNALPVTKGPSRARLPKNAPAGWLSWQSLNSGAWPTL